MFQGSFFPAIFFFLAPLGVEPFGGTYQVLMVKALLDNGFAVIAPDAIAGGITFWNTNIPPWDSPIEIPGLWSTAPDARLLANLFTKIKAGEFGPLDMGHMHAAGISSGGYMASRMAWYYPDQIRSVIIESAAFYYCAEYICVPPPPGSLKQNHPPTLFLHGTLDVVVPIWTMQWYADAMTRAKLVHKVVINPLCGHEWLPTAPQEVLNWVIKYN